MPEKQGEMLKYGQCTVRNYQMSFLCPSVVLGIILDGAEVQWVGGFVSFLNELKALFTNDYISCTFLVQIIICNDVIANTVPLSGVEACSLDSNEANNELCCTGLKRS